MYGHMPHGHTHRQTDHSPAPEPGRARGARGVPAPPDPRVVSLQSRSLCPVVTLESAYTISRYATRYSSSQSQSLSLSPWPLATGLARTVALSTQYSATQRSGLGTQHSPLADSGTIPRKRAQTQTIFSQIHLCDTSHLTPSSAASPPHSRPPPHPLLHGRCIARRTGVGSTTRPP